MFDRKGVLTFSKKDVTEEKLMEIALEAGAEDITDEESFWQVVTAPSDFEAVRNALDKAGLKPLEAEISKVPQSTVKLSGKEAQSMLKLMDALEELDDVQHTYANFDISLEEMEKLSA
jgi:transcriptional/translational regulatory protein YebC/TACO1